jgi:uncharacterized protein (DUF1697 family)
MTYVALLRGINVGRAKQVAMADVREIAQSLGFRDVRTLLRSGNVVFTGPMKPANEVAADLAHALEARLGMTVGVVIRTADELAAVVDANPMPEAVADGSRLHVMFLADAPTAKERAALDGEVFDPDTVRPSGREIYAWYPNGMSGSDTATRLAKIVRTLNTDRNWNTVTKLLAMTETKE